MGIYSAIYTLINTTSFRMRDFSSYEFEDFITDPSFINYAKKTEPENIIIWKDWLAKNPENQNTAEEAKNFINHIVPRRKSLQKNFIDNEWNRLCNRVGNKTSIKLILSPSHTTQRTCDVLGGFFKG